MRADKMAEAGAQLTHFLQRSDYEGAHECLEHLRLSLTRRHGTLSRASAVCRIFGEQHQQEDSSARTTRPNAKVSLSFMTTLTGPGVGHLYLLAYLEPSLL